MTYLIDTCFETPEEVVLNFVKSSAQFCKRCPIGPKGSTDLCLSEALKLIQHYTYFKFHPYSDHRVALENIKNIKEIDFIELINNKETKVHTKKNQSIISACEFTLKRKNKKWKIVKVLIKQGENNYRSVFIN